MGDPTHLDAEPLDAVVQVGAGNPEHSGGFGLHTPARLQRGDQHLPFMFCE